MIGLFFAQFQVVLALFVFLTYFFLVDGTDVNFTALGLPPVGSQEHREIWMERIREVSRQNNMVSFPIMFALGTPCSWERL